ncbi:MAG: hypothetical protein ACUVUC_00205 [Thermoguttaceae bacterium]
MAKLSGDKIRELALKIIAREPRGIRFSELVKRISADHPETPVNTIHGSVWDLAARFPDQVVKPSRGLFMPPGEEVPVLPPKVREEDLYPHFARYLKDELDEVTTAEPLGGNALKGKWGTPDVIGVYKPRAGDLIKFPIDIISAEVKTNPQEPVVAFGQAIAYRLFSAKCYVVMPTTVTEDDFSRLEALCMLFGVGLVVAKLDVNPPEFSIRVRAQRFFPDMFYVNEFARRLHQYDRGLFERLFG